MGIMYPTAMSGGREVGIAEAERGGEFECGDCGGGMVAKLGEVVTHHFAHKPSAAADACERDYADTLHNRLCNTIAESAGKGGYYLRTPCVYGGYKWWTIGREWQIEREYSLAPNTRADVALIGRDAKIAVEVAASHPLEPQTRAAYCDAGVIVARIDLPYKRPDRCESIRQAHKSVATADWVSPPRLCYSCARCGMGELWGKREMEIRQCANRCGALVEKATADGRYWVHCADCQPVCVECKREPVMRIEGGTKYRKCHKCRKY